MFLLQEQPIVVEVIKQPAATQDISIDYIITMFQTAGVFLLTAALGGILVGLIFVAIRRLRDTSTPHTGETEHVRLRI